MSRHCKNKQYFKYLLYIVARWLIQKVGIKMWYNLQGPECEVNLDFCYPRSQDSQIMPSPLKADLNATSQLS